MSSLHQDHLLAEGSEPVTGSRPTLAPARGKTRRIAGSAEEKAPNEVPTPRRGKPRTTTTQTTSTARRATGTDAGPTKPRKAAAKPATATAVTTTSAATAKPATAKAPAKPATAKPATARTAAKPATAKAAGKPATAKAAAKPATAKAATAKPAAKPATAKSAATRSAAVKVAAAQAAPATVAAKPRPTPYKRADDAAPLALAAAADAAELADAAEVQALEVVTETTPAVVGTSPEGEVSEGTSSEGTSSEGTSPEALVAAVAQGRRRLFPRRLPTRRRRPALYLAAALAGALGVSLTPADPPSQAHTQTVSHSVSVAEQLGLDADAEPIQEITPEVATERLGQLAASRNERDAEQAQAAQAQVEADRIAAEAAAEAARPKAVFPIQGARLTSGFGPRWGSMHSGLDLAAPMLTPEYAAMDGVVLEAGPASGFGNVVYIQHENGDVTVYGHMEQILVSAGQVVQAGDTIALVGSRGQSTGPHLHFEVHVGGLNGPKVDPMAWLRERGVAV